ncbi:MAG TPA: G5 domain-containing protein [Streptosporangiaceae bacterium]
MAAVLLAGGLLALAACQPDATEPAAGGAPAASAEPSAGTEPAASSGAAAAPTERTSAPTVKKRTVTETRVIPYTTRRVSDSGLAAGTTRVRTPGRTGLKKVTYEVTLTDGVPTAKRLVGQVVIRRPVTRVVVVGTREARRCDPNYSGACVPIASDVDCAGGSGNGPAYVAGPVRVVGSDIYDLDRDGDGVGCD